MKYYIWTLGCAMNYSDSERLAAILNDLGYQSVDKEEAADVILVVACSVRQKAIDRIFGKATKWARLRKENHNLRILLTGCVLENDKENMSKIFDSIFAIEDMNVLYDLVPSEKSGDTRRLDSYLSVHPVYDSGFRAVVPIMTGCNNFCSYCAVPFTRGMEKSRPQEEIFQEVQGLIINGYKEITLVGQNVNSYGSDFAVAVGNHFVELLRKLDTIPGDHRIYFYSNHPKDITDELIGLLPKLVHFPKYIHLPLQSGSNEIIRKMNRHYTKEDFLKIVEKLRGAAPDVAITTDIIVGYPGETESQFLETLDVVQRVGFEMIYCAQYSPRPGSASAKIKDDVPEPVKKERERNIQELLGQQLLKKNEKLIGKSVRVLCDSIKNHRHFGRTDDYKVVELVGKGFREGTFYNLVVTRVEPWKLYAE